MRGFNFTERAQRVLGLAQKEAERLDHEYVGTEHLLLALIREGEGTGVAVLRNLNVDLNDIRLTIDQTIKPGKLGTESGSRLPLTSRAIKVLQLAAETVVELGHEDVGTEHLLLGLIREERGVAAQVLADAGLTLDLVTAETLRVLGSSPDKFKPLSPTRRIASVKVEVQMSDGSMKKVEFNNIPATISYLTRL